MHQFVRGRGRGTGPLNCFYKNITSTAVGGTYDYWAKYQGLAFDEANCYCYALNHFEGTPCAPCTDSQSAERSAPQRLSTCLVAGLHSQQQPYTDPPTSSQLHCSLKPLGIAPAFPTTQGGGVVSMMLRL